MPDENINLSELTTTSEYFDVLRGGMRDLNTSEFTDTSESITLATLQSPPYILRTLSFTLVVPDPISFTLIKS